MASTAASSTTTDTTHKRQRVEEGTISGKETIKVQTETPKSDVVLPPTAHFQTSMEFIKLLVTARAESLRPPNGVVFVAQRTDALVDVWRGLVRHNFLSCPVLQKKGSKYYGFIDLADIVIYVVDHFGARNLETSDDYWALALEDEIMKKKTVNDLMLYPISRRNPFHPVPKGYSLFSVIEALGREVRLHRVPILDENRKLVGLVTQSGVVDFLHKNMHLIGNKKEKPLSMCIGALRNVYTITEQSQAIDAFRMMSTQGISGIAIVNNEGKLMGNISLRDLKAIGTDGRMFGRLFETIKNFMPKLRKDYGDERPHRVVALKVTDTLQTAINMLAENNIHRVYIVDDSKKPIGVISLKDILLNVITDH